MEGRGDESPSARGASCQRKPARLAMPVHGLWELLKGRGLVREINGAGDVRELLEGKKVAVDLAIWVVEGDVAVTATGRHGWPDHFLLVTFWRAAQLLRVGCSPVGVADAPEAPSLKRRQRRKTGLLQRRLEPIVELFRALGCPTFQAQGEAEGLCAALSRNGAVDAVASSDSDVFPFGALGLVLKDINIGRCGENSWRLVVVDVASVHDNFGFGQQGLICLANFAGCDFSVGVEGVGAEKGLLCVRSLLRRCDEGSLRSKFSDALETSLSPELRSLCDIKGCQTCRHCGHGHTKQQRHGPKGCEQCGTSSGCLPRVGDCHCEFHGRHDEIALARSLLNADELPQPKCAQSTWNIYENEVTAVDGSAPVWRRPDVLKVAYILQHSCSYPTQSTIRCLLPALLQWDLRHPEDPESFFEPTGVIAETLVGLSYSEKRTISTRRSLLVLDWRIRAGRGALAETRGGAALQETLQSVFDKLTKPQRAVSRTVVMRCRPDLVADFCERSLNTRATAPRLATRFMNFQHWRAVAERSYADWGFGKLPESTTAMLTQLDTAWRREAVRLCVARVKDGTGLKDPWAEVQKVLNSFGQPFDHHMREELEPMLVQLSRQRTLAAFFRQPCSAARRQATTAPRPQDCRIHAEEAQHCKCNHAAPLQNSADGDPLPETRTKQHSAIGKAVAADSIACGTYDMAKPRIDLLTQDICDQHQGHACAVCKLTPPSARLRRKRKAVPIG